MAIILTKPPAGTVTVHGFPLPEGQFVQTRVEFGPGVAVKTTILFGGENRAPQAVPGQLIPGGELETVPVPVPAGVTTNSPFVAAPGQFGPVPSMVKVA